MDWAILRVLFPLFALCAVLWIILQFLRLLRLRKPGLGPVPFRRAESILSPAERAFFDVLRQAIGRDLYIFVKVRMEDVFNLPAGIPNRKAWTGKVRQKHLDFVLCDPQTLAPVLVIELDDSTHQRADAQTRDAVKDAILNAAGLPILRVTARREYLPKELSQSIANRLRNAV